MWSPEERGMAMSVYSLAPLVGPSTGPLVGGWIAERTTWSWTFWSVSIVDALVQIVGFVRTRKIPLSKDIAQLRSNTLPLDLPSRNLRS